MPLYRAELLAKKPLWHGALIHDVSCRCYLPFDYDDGSYARDRSGYNNHGTIYGAALAAGKVGMARRSDGIDDCVEIPAKLFSYPMTVMFWLNPADATDRHLIYASEGSGDGWGGDNETHISTSGGRWSFFCRTGGVSHLSRAFGSPTLNVWQFVAVVLDSTYKFYIDATLLDSASIVGIPDFTAYETRTYIGRPSAAIRFAKGLIDEPRIIRRAASAAEIRMLMYRRF